MSTRRMIAEEPIDFVLTWVDGSDEAWRKQKEYYASGMTENEEARNAEERYRDMGLLKYWFRGVEVFAPWVNKVHFVTCGQNPDWLNTNHPKLHPVNHSDYIPREFLPTFNSCVIELGMHRIPGLSEQFVYFNDDMFLTAPMAREDFFKNGLPRDMYEIRALVSFDNPSSIDYTILNDIGQVNKHFFGRKSKLRCFSKKISPAYPPGTNIRNLVNLAWPSYFGIGDHHLPFAYRKQDFKDVWAVEEERLTKVLASKFRTPYDLNHWIFRYWHLVTGEFIPTNYHRYAKFINLGESREDPLSAVRNQTYKILCLNDNKSAEPFEEIKAGLIGAFEEILPDKSSFEL